MRDIEKLEKKVEKLHEVIFVMYLQMDRVAQFRLDKAYPQLKIMREKLNNGNY